MAAPPVIGDLLERFRRNEEAYRSGRYNEAQVRQEFIDPLFEALGWDIANKQGYAETYKDVIHEDAIKIGGHTKAPDYCFRVGGARKFFVEAKKPSIDLQSDAAAAFQLRHYAWNAKLPLGVLTNFAEFAVYDCRFKPSESDKAQVGRVLYITCSEFQQRWHDISSVFHRQSVLLGSFDRFAEAKKKGTTPVDASFLKDIEEWRKSLASNLAVRNPDLTQPQLNLAVQQIIDRIIFLRICEDRGIEIESRLSRLVEGDDLYARLCHFFLRADDRYDSGLFHFRAERGRKELPDTLTLHLAIDDKVLRPIIQGLYPPCPYEFSILPADILGQVYEQFLGKVIRLTPGHQARVDDKPEVKKAGGVYYTPTYVVDHIVSQTLGTVLQGKTPRQASRIKVLDPACGSGSFLIAAYQHLLDWHRDQYVARGPAKHRNEVFRGSGGAWRLTTTERKRILVNSIFGVDIDAQAVEVTKLSLMLKVLEGATAEEVSSQLRSREPPCWQSWACSTRKWLTGGL